MIVRRGCLVAAGAMLVATPAWPQDVPVRRLSQPEVAFEHGFTRVEGIRELTDGRVIVLDVADRTVQVIDAAWAAMSQIGRQGAGPGEYRRPYKLFALPRDSSAVLDQQNGRMLVITPDAEPGGFLNPKGAAGQRTSRCPGCRFNPAGVYLLSASAADGRGFFYVQANPIVASSSDGELRLAGSAAIERWTRTSAGRDTVGFVPFSLKPGSMIFRGSLLSPRPREITAFATWTQWAIAPNGRLAIVYFDPYRVRFYHPTGKVLNGPPVEYEPLRVTEAHKRQWREKQQQRRPMLVVTREAQSEVVSTTPQRVEPKWPKYLPPFLSRAVHFASDGMLWVQRTTPVGEPPTFDIIDETGRVVEQVKLPHSSRLVGFGKESVYLVRIDEVDLEYLERYRLPPTGSR